MSWFELAAGVIGIFFAAGIVTGILVVTVRPRLRGRGYMRGDEWRELPPSRHDDGRPPRWPGA